MLTLDTNIIINFSIEDELSEKVVERYRSMEEKRDSFITHKVRDQSIDFASKLTHYTFLVRKRMEQKNLSFQEAHEDILEDFQGLIKDPLRGLLGNIINYLKSRTKTKADFNSIKKKIVRKIRFFQSSKRNIQPPLSSIDKEEKKWKNIEEFIQERNLVASEDVEIVMQIWRFYKFEKSEIDLVTCNLSDFHPDKKGWNEKLSFLSVFNPEDWLLAQNL